MQSRIAPRFGRAIEERFRRIILRPPAAKRRPVESSRATGAGLRKPAHWTQDDRGHRRDELAPCINEKGPRIAEPSSGFGPPRPLCRDAYSACPATAWT